MSGKIKQMSGAENHKCKLKNVNKKETKEVPF